MTETQKDRSAQAIKELMEIISRLRSPSDGCPWDLEQTHVSLIPYLLEEAHEEAIKIAKNDDNFAKTIVTRWIGNRVDYSES